MENLIKVLDHGYVRLVDHMGSDLTIANAARVSYGKQVDTLTDKDVGLIRFLAANGHTSPFRHATLQFEVYAPLMTARQWWKYVVGSDHAMDAWNESSRRYITEEPVFYVPTAWRSAPANSKQGSGPEVNGETEQVLTHDLMKHIDDSIELYEKAMLMGVCAEQARLFLPAYGLYVRWYWTASLQSVAHLLRQRLAKDAQKEFQLFAQAVDTLARIHFPLSLEELVK